MTGLRFDPDALRAKYREERDKRLRPDGIGQYVELIGKFEHLERDPYATPEKRAPLSDEVDVALIGAGFGGLLAGARLRELGVESVRLIEKGGDVGGTWYWNRYPGLACDIESYVYLPLLEELGTMPVEKYSRGPEIFAHCQAIAKKYDLYRDALFQTSVTEIRWDADASRWIVFTDHGDAIRARFVVLSNGFLHKPKLPGVPGIETFGGHVFHTCRWDYAYTGGDANGNLVNLHDKRVGIIGTGATAVQCIPHLGSSAGHLYVFQRTPSSIGVRGNRPTDPEWAKSLEPGWQQKRIENFQIVTGGGFATEDLVNDGWTVIFRKILTMMFAEATPDVSQEAIARNTELADFMQMEEIRARVDEIVADPQTAEALKPWYRQFCKRPCFHDGYLQTFNRPNVTLVDTQGRGVDRITEKGVVVDGTEYALDCLIFATGFEVGTDYSHRSGYDIVGRDGLTLTQKWADGVRTFHGMHIRGFPNCFLMSIAQSGFTANFPYVIDIQANHIAYLVDRALREKIDALEASEQAEAEWIAKVVEVGNRATEFAESCTPGYYNAEGQSTARLRQGAFFLGGPTEFADLLAAWRAEGSLQGIETREATLMAQSAFDPSRYRWRKVTGDASSSYPIHHDYTVLGHDRAAGTLDMLVRWYGDGGHCPIHRHAATTTVLVLEGEQHLQDVHPDGSRGAHRTRRAGDYALSTGDAYPHLERGGESGGVAFFGCHTSDGLLYELTDENAKVFLGVTIEWLVKDWEENAA